MTFSSSSQEFACLEDEWSLSAVFAPIDDVTGASGFGDRWP